MTATNLMSRTGVSLGTSAILLAAVGHEDVAQCAALGRHHQVHEDFALKDHAVFKLLLGGRFDRVHALGGCRQVFGHALDHVAGKLEVSIALRVLARQVFHQWQRRAVGMRCGHFAGQRQSLFGQAFGRLRHGIEQLLARQHGQHLALDGFAADDHVERRLHTDHAGQALRATGTGDQAQLDFGQRNAGAGRGNAVVAAQSQFETTAHGHRVDGRHHGLGRVFASADDAQQIGFLDRLGRAKFTDVRTAGEGFARARDDDGFDRCVVVGFFQTIGDADAGGQAQTVDGRVHQRDDRDITVDFVFSCHAGLPLREKLKKNDRSFLRIVVADRFPVSRCCLNRDRAQTSSHSLRM